MKENFYKKTRVLKILIFLLTLVCSATNDDLQCFSNFTLHKFNTPEESKTLCASVFMERVTWSDADALCKINFSYLADRIYLNSSLYLELANKKIDALWVGIRRKANFFIANSSTLFEEKENEWGYFWSEGEPRRPDCVALNMTNGSLYTAKCGSRLPFVCENDGDPTAYKASFPDLDCPKNWTLSLPLSTSGRKCVSPLNKALSQTDAEKLCEENNGRLAFSEEYDILRRYNHFSASIRDTAYWVNKKGHEECLFKTIKTIQIGNSVENNRPENCSKSLKSICVKDFEVENADVSIKDREIVQYSRSSCLTKYILICDTSLKKYGNRQIFQWYKNDIPISSCVIYACGIHFVTTTMKWDQFLQNEVNKQGSYHCEVRIAGLSKSYSSPKLDVFFSDIASYVINIHGINLNSFVDFSHRNFKETMEGLNKTISNLLAKENFRAPITVWDFQSVRVINRAALMKIVVYVNRTNIKDFDNEKVYNKMKMLFESNASNFTYKGNISLSVTSADVCFSSDVQSSETCNDELPWPPSIQATDVMSTDMCLDEYNETLYRECKSNFTSKAKWSDFNCSSCKKFYKRFPDLSFQCPDGYFKFRERNLCYKIYNEKRDWHDAYKTCSESSSYMLNELYDIDIGYLDSLWLSHKYSHGKIQDFGMRPSNLKLKNFDTENHEFHCVSAVLENGIYKLKLENCSSKISFVCLKNPYELESSVKFANTWIKLHIQEACYYFGENVLYTWQDSINACEQTFYGADLLHGIQDINAYKYLKWLIRQKFEKFENTCSSLTWWMNLTSQIENGLVSNIKYADWRPYINFNLTEPRGAIALFPNKKIYWTLAEATSTLRFICEIQKCQDNRPTQAYIEDRSKSEATLSSGDYFSHLKNFRLKCVPSGWFITNSMHWYKDGILLDILSDEFSFNFPSDTSNDSNVTIVKLLQHQGYYSCSVDQYLPLQRIYSSEHLFKIPGIHTFVLSMVSQNKIYLNECPKYMLNEKLFQNISLMECFKNNFEHAFDSYTFHFLVKNLTCNSTHVNIIVHVHIKEEMGTEEAILKRIQNTDFLKFCRACDIEHNISSRSTVTCYGETMMLKNANVTWPNTSIGRTAYPKEMCLTDEDTFLQRRCLGDFNSGAVWSEISTDVCSDTRSIITKQLYQMWNDVTQDSYELFSTLPKLISSPEELQPADVQLILQIFEYLSSQNLLGFEKLDIVVNTISNLIDISPEVINEATDSPNQIVEYFEHIASVVDVEDKNVNIATKNIIVDIYPFSAATVDIPNCIILTNGSTTLLINASAKDLQKHSDNLEAGIVLPTSLIVENSGVSNRVIYAIYKNFNHVKNMKALSPVIDVVLQNVSVLDLGKDEITLFFKINETIKESLSPKCVFWDYRLNSWSYKGCFPREFNEDFVICICNHLTSFAVIVEMDHTPIPSQHQNILHFITYIGCSLSCIGFGLIIVTFICFKEWRQFIKNKALFNYSISQFIFLFIFMIGINKTNSKAFCKTAAILLHYFLLSSFAWMITLAYTVYLSLVKVLGTYIPCLIQKFMVFAWGTPAVTVIIVLSCNHEYYSRDDFCWLSQDVIIYGIVSPLAVMLTINFFIFGNIVYLNTCKTSLLMRLNQDRRTLIATRTKALFCTSILLGLSWIFGLFAIGKAKLLFQYLFSITTPLQGFLLAVFFVIRPKSTRERWFKIFYSSNSMSAHTVNSVTVSNKVENSRTSKYM